VVPKRLSAGIGLGIAAQRSIEERRPVEMSELGL
jgi:hypothetical protein